MPNGTCYEDAASCIVGKIFRLPDGERIPPQTLRTMRLVHGYPRLSRDDGEVEAGTKYGHAWIEYNWDGLSWCFDASKRRHVRKHVYYEAGRIEPNECVSFDRLDTIRRLVAPDALFTDWNPNPPADAVWSE